MSRLCWSKNVLNTTRSSMRETRLVPRQTRKLTASRRLEPLQHCSLSIGGNVFFLSRVRLAKLKWIPSALKLSSERMHGVGRFPSSMMCGRTPFGAISMNARTRVFSTTRTSKLFAFVVLAFTISMRRPLTNAFLRPFINAASTKNVDAIAIRIVQRGLFWNTRWKRTGGSTRKDRMS